MKRFYCATILSGEVELDGDESHHLIHVMRLGEGERIEVFDGKGAAGKGVITRVSRNSVKVEVTEVLTHPQRKSGRVVIATSVAKGQRFDWLISKCTELGVDHIAAVQFDRTVKLAKGVAAMERYEKLAISAGKQCGRVFLPKLTGPCDLETTLSGLMQEYPSGKIVYGGLGESCEPVMQQAGRSEDVIAFVGPEGGLTEQEEGVLKDKGCVGVKLSDTVLRIETAAIAFASILCCGRDGEKV